MSLYYVFQGTTYQAERNGGYVWSPQRTRAGTKNVGYTTMTEIKKGDFILHHNDGKMVALSIAKNDCYVSEQPAELSQTQKWEWAQIGYRVDTQYVDFQVPLLVTSYAQWLKEHHIEKSAFTKEGGGKQRYMCHLADEHAIFLLEEAIVLQGDTVILNYLKGALSEIVRDKESEYEQTEVEVINELVGDVSDNCPVQPTWPGIKEAPTMTVSSSTGREIPKRNLHRAADALARAQYLCEYNPDDRTFPRKNGKPYTEPHHLIPISKYRDFTYNVDVMENIVSLCSHCHNLLHYGRIEDKRPILQKLYAARIDALRKCGLSLTLKQLEAYYQ